jgi:hypothetical protein
MKPRVFILKGIYIHGDLKRVLKTMRQGICTVVCLVKFFQREGAYKKCDMLTETIQALLNFNECTYLLLDGSILGRQDCHLVSK